MLLLEVDCLVGMMLQIRHVRTYVHVTELLVVPNFSRSFSNVQYTPTTLMYIYTYVRTYIPE